MLPLARTGKPPNHARLALRGEQGVGLIVAVVAVLILALLVAGIAQLVAADYEIARLTKWDTMALYLAQAGLEHQIYVLKASKSGGSVGPVNWPVTPGQEYWYRTTLTCLLLCGSNRESRRWRIIATGEIRQRNPDLTFTILQTRAIRAWLEIAYSGSGSNLYQFPTEVTILRWEEVLP